MFPTVVYQSHAPTRVFVNRQSYKSVPLHKPTVSFGKKHTCENRTKSFCENDTKSTIALNCLGAMRNESGISQAVHTGFD